MSSGIYSAVSGAVSRLQLMDTITDNLSNSQTTGFKKGGVAFSALLEQPQNAKDARGVDFTQLKGGYSDFSQGTLTRTNIPMQLAIEGEGFFKVQNAEGDTFFTRQGDFHRDPEGNLRTSQQMLVLGTDGRPISLPADNVEIDEEGNAKLPDGDTKQIPIYKFAEDGSLKRVGGSLFTSPNPDAAQLVEKPTIYQGYVEDSNVSTMQEMGAMIDALRQFEACQKVMKTYNELDGKANEIGILA